MFKIAFSGKHVDGLTKKQVIHNLSKLLKLSPGAVEQKLFTGKAVIIKVVENLQQAEQYRLRFAKAGAIVEIIEEATLNSSQEPHSGNVTAPNNTNQKFRQRLKVISAVAIVAVFLLGGAYYWVTTSMLDFNVPADVPAIEKALAESDLMAIAHINIAKSIELQNTLLGFSGDGLVDPNGKGLFADMCKAGINPQHSISHVLAGFYVKEPKDQISQSNSVPASVLATEAWGSFVFLGDFPVNKVRNFIKQHYETETISLGKYKLLQFRKQDIDTCRYTLDRVIQIREHRLVISEPAHIKDLLNRLNEHAAAVTDISQWQRYRNQHLFSVGIIAPKQSKHAVRGFIGMMIAGMQKQIAPVDAIYAGGTVEVLPPSLTLHASLASKKQTWIDATREKWQTGLNNFKDEMAKQSSPMVKMMDKLNISSDQGDLKLALSIDRDLGNNGGELVQGLLADAFSISTSHKANQTAQAEQLDNDPIPFNVNYALGELPRYGDLEFMHGKHSWSKGPFAIDITKVELDSDDNIAIHLKSEARGLRNLGNIRKNVFLHVTDALDGGGNSLLRHAKCGRDRNDKAEPYGFIMRSSNPTTPESNKALIAADGKIHYTEVSANKKVNLASGAKLTALRNLKGFVDLDQPTQLGIKTLATPLAGQQVKYKGMLLSIKDTAGGVLSFNVSGDKSKLLNVRGLNNAKKPLKRTESSSIDSFFGNSSAYSYNYAGEIAYVEVVLVKNSVDKRFPFEIDRLMPENGDEYIHTVELINTFKRRQFTARFAKVILPPIKDKAGWMGKPTVVFNKGPLAMAIYSLKTLPHFGAAGSIKVNLPLIPGLNNNLSGVEILSDMISTVNGENHSVDLDDYIELSRPRKYILNGKPVYEKNKTFLEGQKNISLHFKAKSEPISRIEGKVRLRLPSELKHVDFEIPTFGKQVGIPDIALRLIAISPGSMEFRIIGDRSKLVRINMLNKDHKVINRSPQINKGKRGLTAVISFSGDPVRMQLIYAPKQDIVSFPFEFKISKN